MIQKLVLTKTNESERVLDYDISVCSYLVHGFQPRQLAFDSVQLPTRLPAGPVDCLGHPGVVAHPQSLTHPSQRHRRPPPKPPRQHHLLRRTLGQSLQYVIILGLTPSLHVIHRAPLSEAAESREQQSDRTTPCWCAGENLVGWAKGNSNDGDF